MRALFCRESFIIPGRNAYRVSETLVDLRRCARCCREMQLHARPQDLLLDVSRTALIVIDMQNDFCAPDGWMASLGVDVASARALAGPMNRSTAALRANGVPVLWVNWGVRPDRLNLSPEGAGLENDRERTAIGARADVDSALELRTALDESAREFRCRQRPIRSGCVPLASAGLSQQAAARHRPGVRPVHRRHAPGVLLAQEAGAVGCYLQRQNRQGSLLRGDTARTRALLRIRQRPQEVPRAGHEVSVARLRSGGPHRLFAHLVERIRAGGPLCRLFPGDLKSPLRR